MTAKSFAEYLEEVEPVTIRASHYALAPDIYGLEDGYQWALGSDTDARHYLPQGGEWPYYIAAVPSTDPAAADRYTAATAAHCRALPLSDENPDTVAAALTEGRVLETYCEGDLTAYIFADTAERDTAAERWQESRAELVGRILEEDYSHNAPGQGAADTAEDADSFAAAVLNEVDSRDPGEPDGEELREAVAGVMDERYRGEWGSMAAYVQESYEDTIPSRETEDARARAAYAPRFEGILPGDDLWNYIDWEKVARDWLGQYNTYPTGNGNVYIFEAA